MPWNNLLDNVRSGSTHTPNTTPVTHHSPHHHHPPTPGSSIFNLVNEGRKNSTDVNLDDVLLPLTRMDSYHSDEGSSTDHGNHVEPGLFNKETRVTIVKSKQDAMVNMTLKNVRELLSIRRKGEDHSPVWIDMQALEDDMMAEVADIFGLHPLTVEDCMLADTREKIENRNGYVFMVVQDFSVHAQEHYTSSTSTNLYLILFPDLLLSIHPKPVHSVYAVAHKLDFCPDKTIPSIEFVLYVILSRVLDYHEAHVEQIGKEAEELDEQVLGTHRISHRESALLLGRIGATTKRTSALLEVLGNKREIFAALMRHDNLFTHNGMRYIKNANDQVLKMHMQLTLAHETLSDINTLYMAKLNVQLSMISNEVDTIMKRFGAIGAIFLPLNLVAGIFGMNVLVPEQADAEQPRHHAFVTLLIVMAGTSIAQIAVFRYLRWI